jgi:hypothetical protein
MDAVQEVHGCRAGSVVGAKTSYAPTMHVYPLWDVIMGSKVANIYYSIIIE